MNLPIETQKRLTKFLGECWHEWHKPEDYVQALICTGCGKTQLGPTTAASDKLDFDNWRVVGRAVSKLLQSGKSVTFDHTVEQPCGFWEDVLLSIGE